MSIGAIAMQDAERKWCPFCANEVPASALLCSYCGRDLHAMKIANPNITAGSEPYRVVLDATCFGIAFEGKIIIHGLELERARSLAEILNNVAEIKEAG
jgi:hypothetical protein